MIKGIKIRLYPTKAQEELMWKHIHASRFIYNYMLALQNERYENGEKHLYAFDMHKLLTPLKKQDEFAWLNEVSNYMLCASCVDLSDSFSRFFKKQSKHPRFKSRKKAKSNFPVRSNCLYFKDGTSHVVQTKAVAEKQ